MKIKYTMKLMRIVCYLKIKIMDRASMKIKKVLPINKILIKKLNGKD